MKIVSLYLLLYKLSNNYIRSQSLFSQIITGIIFGFSYLLEYIFIFSFQKMYIYNLYIHRYIAIKKKSIFNKNTFFSEKNISIKKKNKKQTENKYVKLLNKLYYHRRMYWGLTVVYIHIFLRKIRESKNYIIHLINTRIIWGYKVLKWRIRIYSIFYFFWYNYRLFLYYKRFKKKIKKIVMFIVNLSLYIKIKIKTTIKIKMLILIKKFIINKKIWK
jgi:hypothetical protein